MARPKKAVEEVEEESVVSKATKNKGKSPNAAWFQEGFGAADAEIERQKVAKESASSRTPRMYLRQGDKRQILVLDQKVFNIREHSATAPGKKVPDFKTCLHGVADHCPACDAGNRNSFTAFLTVIDLNTWNPQKKAWEKSGWAYTKGPNAGKRTENEKKLFPMKAATASIINHYNEDWGGLAGTVITIFRSQADKSPTVGDSFTKVEKINFKNKSDLKKYGLEGVDLKPFNYEEELAPMTPQQMSSWLSAMGVENAEVEETANY